MMEKARLFGDHHTFDQMKDMDNPVMLKRMGKTVTNFQHATWKREIDNIFFQRLHAKFTQNADLLDFLRNTGTSTLIEANPHDKIFAVGLPLF